jgi:hypothetical protein
MTSADYRLVLMALYARADRAYVIARRDVFDLERFGADPSNRTPRQICLVEDLEEAQAALEAHRQTLPKPPS